MRKNRHKNLYFSQHEQYYKTVPFSAIISAITSGHEKKEIDILYIYPYRGNKSLGVRLEPKDKRYRIVLSFRGINESDGSRPNPGSIIERMRSDLDEALMNKYSSVWKYIESRFNERFETNAYDYIDILFEYNQAANRKNKYKEHFLAEYKKQYLIGAPYYEILFNFKIVGYIDETVENIVFIKDVPNFAILPLAEFINLALL